MKTLFARLDMYSIFVSLFLPIINIANAHTDTKQLRIKAGIAEHLPSYKASPKGTLIIDDPVTLKLVTCIEKQLNADITWHAYPTARVEGMLLKNELDFIFPFQFTEERLQNMLPSTPTWMSGMYFLANKKIDVQNKTMRVGARVNSPEHQYLLKKAYKNISAQYDYTSLSRMLNSNSIDAAAVPEIAYSKFKELWSKDVQITQGETREAGFFLNKEDPKQLRNKLNAAILHCRIQKKI